MGGYLLDTNAVSESIKRSPHARVAKWLKQAPPESLYTSVLTLGEIRKGIERLPAGKKKMLLLHWLETTIPQWFGEHILNVDRNVADVWGRLVAGSRRTLPGIDSLLAATAIAHGLTLVTRNAKDFSVPSLQVYNPWDDA